MILCLQDTPRYSPMTWESSAAYCFGDSSALLALWMIPYVWYSLFTSLVIDLLILQIQGVRLHAIVSWSLWIHPSSSDVIPDVGWFLVNQFVNDWPSSFFPTCPCLIDVSGSKHWYKNQNSFELKRRVIQTLLSSDDFAWFRPLVEYRYSYETPCTSPDLSGGLLPTFTLCLKSWMIFPLKKEDSS